MNCVLVRFIYLTTIPNIHTLTPFIFLSQWKQAAHYLTVLLELLEPVAHSLEFICLFCVYEYVCPLRVLDSTGMCVFGCPSSPQDVKWLMLIPGELIKIPPSGGCHNHPRQTAPPCCIVMLPICLQLRDRAKDPRWQSQRVPRSPPVQPLLIPPLLDITGPGAGNQGQGCTDKNSLIYGPLNFKWSGTPAWHTYTVGYQHHGQRCGKKQR